jgi:Ca2+-binding EF-hand superfamily protein
MKKSLFLPFALMFLAATGCNSTKTAATEEKAAVEQRDERPQRGGERKTPEERFAEMDANKDGKIAKSETAGRMAENFATIDANSDGFITLEEMKKVRPAGGRPGGRPGGGK